MIMVNLFLKTFAIVVGLNLIAAFSLSKEFFYYLNYKTFSYIFSCKYKM